MAACVFALVSIAQAESGEQHLVKQKIKNYSRVKTLTCRVRRTAKSSDKTLTFLSKVFYKKGGFLHSKTVSPYKRTVVANGKKLYSYFQNHTKGVAKDIEKLEKNEIINLRKAPGTPMDHLYRLADSPQTKLDPTAKYPERYAYTTKNAFVVVSLDKKSRIKSIAFYNGKDMKGKKAETIYSRHKKVDEDLWIPCLHESTVYHEHTKTVETIHFNNLEVNVPVAENLFIPGNFMPDVEFVDSYSDLR